MNILLKKIKSTSGESIGETLVSLLIASLALVMMAGAVSAAVRMTTRSSTALQAYYESANELADPSTGALTVKFKDGANEIKCKEVPDSVKYSINGYFSNIPVISYAVPETEPSTEAGTH